jgi:hypothetical protein
MATRGPNVNNGAHLETLMGEPSKVKTDGRPLLTKSEETMAEPDEPRVEFRTTMAEVERATPEFGMTMTEAEEAMAKS